MMTDQAWSLLSAALWAGLLFGVGLIAVGVVLDLRTRRSGQEPAPVRAYVEPPEEEQTGG